MLYEQIVIEEYDKPLTLRSAVSRSPSSLSLKELAGELKIYHKMSPATPRRRRQQAQDTASLSTSATKRYLSNSI